MSDYMGVSTMIDIERQIVTPIEREAENGVLCRDLHDDYQYTHLVLKNAPLLNSVLRQPGDYIELQAQAISFGIWNRFLDMLRGKGFDVVQSEIGSDYIDAGDKLQGRNVIIGWKLKEHAKDE